MFVMGDFEMPIDHKELLVSFFLIHHYANKYIFLGNDLRSRRTVVLRRRRFLMEHSYRTMFALIRAHYYKRLEFLYASAKIWKQQRISVYIVLV